MPARSPQSPLDSSLAAETGGEFKPVGWLGRRARRFMGADRAGALLIVGVLALGIGLVATIYACLESYLFRGLPFVGSPGTELEFAL